MKKNALFLAGALCLAGMLSCQSPASYPSTDTSATISKADSLTIPHLEKRGEATQLIVGGKPFLVLAGELHNSTCSSTAYMKGVWPQVKAMNLNTVLAVVSWEQVEPEEGKFDFKIVDDLMGGAQKNKIKLVVLWFGSWKNGITSYVPEWVKADSQRFPYVMTKDGATLPILSTLGKNSMEADAKAYAALMKHIKATDKDNTVIMMQIENEVGLHGDTRDFRPQAVTAFQGNVPAELMNYLSTNKNHLLPELLTAWNKAGAKTSGTWEQVFGKGDYTDEIFMAWNYARYLEAVTAAGKAEYALPMFTNTWIVQPQDKHPGDYPSGGAVAQVHDIWRSGAPSIDILAPDIYLPEFPEILDLWARGGNPVFVPESAAGLAGAANAFYTIGAAKGIGYSPFGIDSRVGFNAEKNATNTATDAHSEVANYETDPLCQAYALLGTMTEPILEAQAKGTIGAAWLSAAQPKTTLTIGDYKVSFELRKKIKDPAFSPKAGYGMVIYEGNNEFLVAGLDVQVTFAPAQGKGIIGLDKVEEGIFEKGQWVPGRWLNGDETQLRYDLKQANKEGLSGFGLRFGDAKPSLQRVWLYKY